MRWKFMLPDHSVHRRSWISWEQNVEIAETCYFGLFDCFRPRICTVVNI